MKNPKVEILRKFFNPLINFFEQRGIAGTFPVMVVGITIAVLILKKRRAKKFELDVNDFLLIVGIIGLIIVFITDQINR